MWKALVGILLGLLEFLMKNPPKDTMEVSKSNPARERLENKIREVRDAFKEVK